MTSAFSWQNSISLCPASHLCQAGSSIIEGREPRTPVWSFSAVRLALSNAAACGQGRCLCSVYTGRSGLYLEFSLLVAYCRSSLQTEVITDQIKESKICQVSEQESSRLQKELVRCNSSSYAGFHPGLGYEHSSECVHINWDSQAGKFDLSFCSQGAQRLSELEGNFRSLNPTPYISKRQKSERGRDFLKGQNLSVAKWDHSAQVFCFSIQSSTSKESNTSFSHIKDPGRHFHIHFQQSPTSHWVYQPVKKPHHPPPPIRIQCMQGELT